MVQVDYHESFKFENLKSVKFDEFLTILTFVLEVWGSNLRRAKRE